MAEADSLQLTADREERAEGNREQGVARSRARFENRATQIGISIAAEAERTGKSYYAMKIKEESMEEGQKYRRAAGSRGRPFAVEPEGLMTGVEIRAERKRRGMRGIDLSAAVGLGKKDLSNVEAMAGRYVANRVKIQKWFEEHPAEAGSLQLTDDRAEQKAEINHETHEIHKEEEAIIAAEQEEPPKVSGTSEQTRPEDTCHDTYCCPVCGFKRSPDYRVIEQHIVDECESCELKISIPIKGRYLMLEDFITMLKVQSLNLDSMWRMKK